MSKIIKNFVIDNIPWEYNSNGYTYSLAKRNINDKLVSLFLLTSEKDSFDTPCCDYLCIFNTETQKIECCIDSVDKDIMQKMALDKEDTYHSFIRKITGAVSKLVFQYIDDNFEKLTKNYNNWLEEIDVDDLSLDIEYCEYYDDLADIDMDLICKNEIEFTIKDLMEYFHDSEKYINNCLKKMLSFYKEEIIDVACCKKYIDEFNKKIELSPYYKQIQDLMNIEKAEQYKTITIDYIDASGNHQIEKTVASDINKWDFLYKYNILSTGFQYGIPIWAINNISWKKQILFDKNNYEKIEIDKSQYIIDWVIAGHENDIDPIYTNDYNLMLDILSNDSSLLNNIKTELSKDPDFMLKVMKNSKSFNVKYIKTSLYDDENFVKEAIAILKDKKFDESAKDKFLYNVNNSFFNSLHNVKLALNLSSNDVALKSVITKIDTPIINDPKCANYLIQFSNLNTVFAHIVKSVKNKETLSIFLKNDGVRNKILDNLHMLTDEIVEDRDFMEYLFEEVMDRKISASNIGFIISKYKDDLDLLKLISKSLYSVSDVVSIANIKDEELLYELSSINCYYAFELTFKQYVNYLACEASSISSYNLTNDVLNLNTEYGHFIFSNDELSYEDNNKNIIDKFYESEFNTITKYAIESLIEINDIFKGCKTLNDVQKTIKDKQIEEII